MGKYWPIAGKSSICQYFLPKFCAIRYFKRWGKYIAASLPLITLNRLKAYKLKSNVCCRRMIIVVCISHCWNTFSTNTVGEAYGLFDGKMTSLHSNEVYVCEKQLICLGGWNFSCHKTYCFKLKSYAAGNTSNTALLMLVRVFKMNCTLKNTHFCKITLYLLLYQIAWY